jgi:hypothetical protein
MRRSDEAQQRSGSTETQTIRLMPTEFHANARRGVRVAAPATPRAPRVAPAMIDLGEAELRGLHLVRRVLRSGLVLGMLGAAWQAGVVIGRF